MYEFQLCKHVYRLYTNCYAVHKGLRELLDVAKRGMISPVRRIDVFWSAEEENFKRIISREIGLIMQGSELIKRHEYR